MRGFAPDWVEVSARRTLARLQGRLGAPGLAAAATLPGLAAAVDQHAAAVRDILTVGVDGPAPGEDGRVGLVPLAGYARGLLDQSRELGRRSEPPATADGWRRADWLTARLLAVCDLARRTPEPHRAH